jgi:hypothetical protein
MSRVHDAMRHLEKVEHKEPPENNRDVAFSNLVGALLGELAEEVSNDAQLEAVKADLLAASLCYEAARKRDLALRFYLAIRSLLRAHDALRERLRKAEKKLHALETDSKQPEVSEPTEESGPAVETFSATAGGHSE